MFIARKINDFVTARQPNAVCDGCIGRALNLSTQTSQMTAALGTTSDFAREKGICAICKTKKVVIHSRVSKIPPSPLEVAGDNLVYGSQAEA